jgi:hypothetical protein
VLIVSPFGTGKNHISVRREYDTVLASRAKLLGAATLDRITHDAYQAVLNNKSKDASQVSFFLQRRLMNT